MRSRAKTVFISLFLFALLSFILVWLYAYMFEAYQLKYTETVKADVLNIIKRNPYDKRNLVFVCIDGLRYSEAFAAEDRYAPHIWNDLRKHGTIFTNAWIESTSLTTTVHSIWLSGNDQYLSNRGYIHPTLPTFIELYRDARTTWIEREIEKLPKPSRYFPLTKETRAEVSKLLDDALDFPLEKTYCIVGKDRILDAVDYSSHPAFGEEYGSSFYRSMPDDDVYAIFEAKLDHDKPRIYFINLADVDEEGHSANWRRYTDAIEKADKIVWMMWNDVQTTPAFRDKTYFFVTADHGRHEKAYGDFAHHGDRCTGCLHVPLLIMGPGIKAGNICDEYVTEFDIQPTIGRMLGIETPFAKGRIIEEAFEKTMDFPAPIETSRTKALKVERQKWDADTTGEWYAWATGNVSADDLMECDEFGLQTYLLGLVDCVCIRGEDAQTAVEIIKANPDRPGAVLPALLLWKYSGDESLENIARKGVADLYQAAISGKYTGQSLRELAVYAPTLCQAGAAFGNKTWMNIGADILRDKMVILEGSESLEGDINQFISRFDYITGGNQMYIREMTPADRALFFAAHGLALDGIEDAFNEEDLYLMKRNFRLQAAFAAPDCDENCLYAGENGFSYQADDIAVNFLYDAAIANNTPWEKEEFIALGYGPEINQTAISDFPADHYFYILNLGNSFQNSGTNFDKIRITINWDDIFNDESADTSDCVTALGAGLLAGARWGRITPESYSFNLFPPEWMD